MSMQVVQGGPLSLLQDSGRRGRHRLGLTNGGPLDGDAFHFCNHLLRNEPGSTAIEISMGGLQLQSRVDTFICVSGAVMALTINEQERDLWSVHRVNAGDYITLGYASSGCRAYLGVAGGFAIDPSFGSTSTVVREGIGGLRGTKLDAGDILPCPASSDRRLMYLGAEHRPRYQKQLTVRVIPGYQQRFFNRIEQRRFFGCPYTVSGRSDRMGYRMEGPPVQCDIDGILSEGICFGAIQVPADGQPIVLLNDRQTIGGYPKIGSALSLDAARMSQLTTGSTVHFAPVSPQVAQKTLRLAQRFSLQRPLKER